MTMEPLSGIFTFAKIGLALLNIAQWFMARADKRELQDQGYQQAAAEITAKTLNSVGITAAAFGRVAGWTDQQVDDALTRPPSPRP